MRIRMSTRSRAASTSRISRARGRRQADPADQAAIPRPRLGYFGVIDERIDLDLLAGVAAHRPDWQLVLHRSRGQDRSGAPAAGAQHPLPWAEELRGAAVVCRRMGRRAAALRAQRGDALHQPDEDAGVPRRRQAGRLDIHPRRRAALWRARTRAHRRRGAGIHQRCRGGDARRRGRAVAPGGRLPRPNFLGQHVDAHVPVGRRGGAVWLWHGLANVDDRARHLGVSL